MTEVKHIMLKTSVDNNSCGEIIQSISPVEKYKFVFLGDAGTGKTSIITRFIYDSFDPTYQSTIGIDFLSKTVFYGTRPIRMQLWDTAGQERFRSLIPSYIRDSSVAIVVYDITNRGSFESVSHWVKDVKDQREDVVLVIVGNKSDLSDNRAVDTEDGEKLAAEYQALFFESSAKCNYNVDTVFKKVIEQLPGEGRPTELEESQKYIRVNVEPSQPLSKETQCTCSDVYYKHKRKQNLTELSDTLSGHDNSSNIKSVYTSLYQLSKDDDGDN